MASHITLLECAVGGVWRCLSWWPRCRLRCWCRACGLCQSARRAQKLALWNLTPPCRPFNPSYPSKSIKIPLFQWCSVAGLHPAANPRMAADATGRGRHQGHLPAPCHAAGPRAPAAGPRERLPRGARQRPERARRAAVTGSRQPRHLGLPRLEPGGCRRAGGRLGCQPPGAPLRKAKAQWAGPAARAFWPSLFGPEVMMMSRQGLRSWVLYRIL